MSNKTKEAKTLAADLTIGDRIRLLQILPEKGPIGTMRLTRKLGERVSLTAKEIEDHKVITLPNGAVQWQDAKWKRTFRFGGFELELILANLRRVNEANTVTIADVELFDQFLPDETVTPD